MRQVGSIDNEQHAHLFADYLVSEGIPAQTDKEEGEWAIWVRDENHVEAAVGELKAFVENPADQRYQGASQRAEQVLQEATQRRREGRRHMVEMRMRWNRGVARRAPLVVALIGASILVTILTSGGKSIDGLVGRLTICQIQRTEEGIRFSSDYFRQIKQGQVWRIVSPIIVHFGLIHLAFNMYMLYYLGGQIENRFGTVWFGILVLVIAVSSNAFQAYMAQAFPNDILGRGPLFGGMSGVNYGLFGYIWMKTVYDPQAGLYVSRGTIFILLAWFVICLFPDMHVANGAHAAGLGMGVAMGYAPELLRPQRRN